MKINRVKIKSEYRKELKDYHKIINDLSAEQRSEGVKCAEKYYDYLATKGILYAWLALDVIGNEGKFGKLANIHLKSQSIFEGIAVEEINTVREKIIISLASHDAKMRSSKGYDQSNPCYDKIEAYHLKVFKYHTSPYAWGGLAPKELIGSGSWMKFYERDEGIFDCAEEIIKSDKIGKGGEYSAERMLKSLVHSYTQYTLVSNTPFELIISTASKEQAAFIWKIDPARIELVEEDISMLDSVSSKVFKAKAAENFVPSGEFDYSSSDSESEEEYSETFAANKVINKQLKAFLSNPSDLKHYQQESLEHAMQELKLAENLVPNIAKSGLESMGEHYEFMQQLIGIKEPTLELQKIKKLEEEEEKIDPYLKDLVQSFQNPQTFIATASTKPKTQEQKVDHEDNDWLNALLSNTASMMHEASSDPDMQQFLKTLGNNSEFNFGDDV